MKRINLKTAALKIGGTFTLGKNVKINPGARLLVKPTDINY